MKRKRHPYRTHTSAVFFGVALGIAVGHFAGPWAGTTTEGALFSITILVLGGFNFALTD